MCAGASVGARSGKTVEMPNARENAYANAPKSSGNGGTALGPSISKTPTR